jgi:hypothetical protein
LSINQTQSSPASREPVTSSATWMHFKSSATASEALCGPAQHILGHFSPCLLCSNHPGLSTNTVLCWSLSHPRVFAPAAPSAWNALILSFHLESGPLCPLPSIVFFPV